MPGAALKWKQKTFITGSQEIRKPELCSPAKAALEFNLGEVMRVKILLCICNYVETPELADGQVLNCV